MVSPACRAVVLLTLVAVAAPAAATSVRELMDPAGSATALASADLDQDGVPDLVVGHADGSLTLLRGVAAAQRPWLDPAGDRSGSPFRAGVALPGLPGPIDFLAAGDLDADGHADVVAAARGAGALVYRPGRGDGSLGEPVVVELPGPITAFAAGEVDRADGLLDLLVAVGGDPALLVFSSPLGALRAAPDRMPLPAAASAVVVAQLDGDAFAEAVVAADRTLLVRRGRDRRPATLFEPLPARIETLRLPAPAVALAAGPLSRPDRDDVAVLLAGGELWRVSSTIERERPRLRPERAGRLDGEIRTLLTARTGGELAELGAAGARVQVGRLAVPGKAVAALAQHLDGDARADLVVATAEGLLMLSEAPRAVYTVETGGDQLSTCQPVPAPPLGECKVYQPVASVCQQVGPCNLRRALSLATSGESIGFAAGVTSVTISSAPALPVLAAGVTLDGGGGRPHVSLSGKTLALSSGATITGLAISGGTLTTSGAVSGCRLLDTYVGADSAGNPAGTTTASLGSVASPATSCEVRGNLFLTSLTLVGPGNLVKGNRFGTDPTGTTVAGAGASLQVSGLGVQVGGTTAGDGNVIAGGGGATSALALVRGTGTDSGAIVQGNRIGVDAAGAAIVAGGSATDGIHDGTDGALIGGTTPAALNVIGGFPLAGIRLQGGAPGALNTTVQGNRIGIDLTGSLALPNGTGISISGAATAVAVGGSVAGAGNVLSGNLDRGLSAAGPGLGSLQVLGNRIGTDASGSFAVPNSVGVDLLQVSGATLGAAGAGNLVSGNDASAFTIGSSGGITVRGNLVGTDATGLLPLANFGGIELASSPSTQIGGATTADGNVVVGCLDAGIRIDSSNATNLRNNAIGLGVDRSTTLPNGGAGVVVTDSASVLIGRSGAGNVISGNTGDGVRLLGATTRLVQVTGNRIGTDGTGALARPNGGHGVLVDSAHDNRIGGSTAGEANVLAGNLGAGVLVTGATAVGNRIQRNVVGGNAAGTAALANGGLGIDLSATSAGDGVTANDVTLEATGAAALEGASGTTPLTFRVFQRADRDLGPNLLQNAPSITAASGGHVQGQLFSTPATAFTLELFDGAGCDPSGRGEGQRYLTAATITTDADGLATFDVLATTTAGRSVSATATDPSNNTSEFSNCLLVGGSPAAGTPVTAGYATVDLEAAAGSDYVATSGTLTFTPGLAFRDLTVSVNGDLEREADERFLVRLAGESGATLAAPVAVGTILDDDLPGPPASFLSIQDAWAIEGQSGSVPALFRVTRSGDLSRGASVAWATRDGLAVAPFDYAAASGTLSFAAGQREASLTVSVQGDAEIEADETFLVRLSGPVGAHLARPEATGTIVDDEAGAPRLLVQDAIAPEAGGSLSFTVLLSAPAATLVTVAYASVPGTADSADFTAVAGILTFAAGQTTRSVAVPLLDDTRDEDDEDLELVLSAPAGASLADARGRGVIVDDDGTPTLDLRGVGHVLEGDAGSTALAFTASLSSASGRPVSVPYTTVAGTASAGSDFVPVAGMLTFAPGALQQTILVDVLGDRAAESAETFRVELGLPDGAALGNGVVTGTVVDDDGPWQPVRVGQGALLAAAGGAGLRVLVGSPGHLWSSQDAVDWTRRHDPDPGRLPLSGIARGAGHFVAVGGCCGADGSAVVLTSDDGLSWTLRSASPLAAGRSLDAVTYDRQFVAVGSTGGIATSADGVVWRVPAFAVTLSELRSVAGNGSIIVAVGDARTLVTSADGSAWVDRSANLPGSVPADTDLRGVTWTGSRFVAVGSGGVAVSSPDGLAWTREALPVGAIALLGVASAAGDAVVAAEGGVLLRLSGGTWTTPALPPTAGGLARELSGVAFDGTGLLAFGSDGALFASTDQGATWSARQLAASRAIHGLAHDGTRYGAVGSQGTVLTSTSGLSWTDQAGLPPVSGQRRDDWNRVAPRAGGGFVAVGEAAAIMTSPDGVAWTDRNPGRVPPAGASAARLADVEATATALVAVGSQTLTGASNEAPLILRSTDGGVTWVQRPTGLTDGVLGAIGFDGTRFVAVGRADTDGTPIFLTSTNAGSTWSALAPPATFEPYETFQDIVFASGRFVGVGDRIWSSTTGTSWVLRQDFGPSLLRAVAFGGPAGAQTWQAVGDGGASYSSTDGNTWTPAAASPAIAGDTRSLRALAAVGNRVLAAGDGLLLAQGTDLPIVSVGDVSAAESAAAASFTVSLSAAAAEAVTLTYATADGSALSGSDYVATAGTLTIPAGQAAASVAVNLLSDTLDEGDETFSLRLSSAVGAAIGDGEGLATILDDDATPAITVGDVSVPEAGGTASFAIGLSAASSRAVRLVYTTAPDNATPGVDYLGAAGTLSFAPGEVAKTVGVPVLGDALDEADETFRLELGGAIGASLPDPTAVGTIVDDDPLPTLSLSGSAVVAERDAAGLSVQFTATLAPASGRSVTVSEATVSGTATAPSDYTSSSGALTFAAGETSKSFSVAIAGDLLPEPTEGFSVALSAPVAAQLGSASASVTIRDEDPAPADFDRNGKSDVVVYRAGAWLFFDFATGAALPAVFTGQPLVGCIPAPADFDGDGKVDLAQLCGDRWYFYAPDGSFLKFITTGGTGSDIPVPADYDGDGKDDVVLFRAGAWFFFSYQTGLQTNAIFTGDPPPVTGPRSIPYPADFDGDGKADFSIYSGGPWHFFNADGSYQKGIWTGSIAGDIPVAGDYDGDGVDEVMVWRAGAWLRFDHATGLYDPAGSVFTGAPAHFTGGVPTPSPVDVDGDGRLDYTVYSGGPWHFYQRSGLYDHGVWCGSIPGDQPISRRPLP